MYFAGLPGCRSVSLQQTRTTKEQGKKKEKEREDPSNPDKEKERKNGREERCLCGEYHFQHHRGAAEGSFLVYWSVILLFSFFFLLIIFDYCSNYHFPGPVKHVRIFTDKETGKPKGFAFVEYYDTNSALSAIKHLDQTELNGRKIKVGFPNQRFVS
jgi:cleavage stimulation factor subunit 2